MLHDQSTQGSETVVGSTKRGTMFSRTAHALAALLVCLAALVNVAPGQTTWYVDDDAPGDPGPGDPSVSDPLENGTEDHPFDAIQEAIDASSDADTVLVSDGTYTEHGNRDIDFGGRLIAVRSENGPESCTVDCQGSVDYCALRCPDRCGL